MRVAVIGAGIVGVTTAYELTLQGHEVSVFERRGSVASEASFANAGLIAPALAPTTPARLLGPWFSAGALAQAPWMWRKWRADHSRVQGVQRQALHRLAQFSRARMLELTRTLHLEFEQTPGLLLLLRAERELKQAQPGLAMLRDWGVAHDVVDAARCRALEPGLHAGTALHAGIHLPQDGVGNCRQFAHLLKAEAQRGGARFRFDTDVTGLQPGTTVTLALGAQPPQTFDAAVVCAGSQANRVLSGAGVKLPLAAVHGYSVTAPLRHLDGLPAPGPRAALVDERHQVTISRLGQRIRVAGGSELGGSPDQHTAGALRLLYRVLDDWFPGAALTREAQHWKGARPTLPDGPPVLGASGAPGVWLNLGHGASGWTLACGSARVLAEALTGREAPIDLSGLTAARLR